MVSIMLDTLNYYVRIFRLGEYVKVFPCVECCIDLQLRAEVKGTY